MASDDKTMEITQTQGAPTLDHVEDKDVSQRAHDEEPFTWQSIMAVIAIICVYQGYLFTLVMPNSILAFINADLGPSPIYTWISVSWNLGAAILVSVGGRLSDIFGRRYFFMAAPAISCIGAIVGATGQSIGQMVASGVLFGIGGGLGEMSLGVVQEIVPNRWRVTILGICDVATTISAFSPLTAYAFIAYSPIKWRAVYWFAFSVEFFALVMITIFYKPPTFETKHAHEHKSKMALLRQLDYVGLFLFASGLTLLLMGITWGGGAYPWKSASVICTIVIGVLLLLCVGLWSRFANLQYPLFPRRLFHDLRKFAVYCGFITIANSLYYALGILWPRQSGLLYVSSTDIIMRGLYANVPYFGIIIGGWWSALVVPRIGHEKWQLVAYMTIQTAIVGSMASAGRNNVQAIVLVIITLWVNIPMSVLNFAMVSLGLENQEDIGISAGLLSTSRLSGGAIAAAIYSSIQTSRFSEVLPGNVAEAAASSGFNGDLKALTTAAATNTAAAYNQVAGMTAGVMKAVQTSVENSYIDSFKLVYLVAIAFGGLAICLALVAKPIDPAVKTNERAVRLENETKVRKDAV